MKYIIFSFFLIFFNFSFSQQKNKITVEYGYYRPSGGPIYGLSYERKFFNLKKHSFYMGVNASYGGKYGMSVSTSTSGLYAVGDKLTPYSVSHFNLTFNFDLNENKEKFGLLLGIESGIKSYVIPRVVTVETFSLGQSVLFINESDNSFCLTPRINPYYRLKFNEFNLDVGVYYKAYVNKVFGQSLGFSICANL